MSHEPAERRESPAERSRIALPSEYYLAFATRTIETVAFWTAVALPFLYVPLFLSGLDTTSEALSFLGLLLLNVIALVVGHPHADG